MAYVAVEGLLDKSCGSLYKLVILAAKRSLELAEGQPKLVEGGPAVKPTTMALREIGEGKVYCKKAKS